jgi:hypothetical protein
MLRVFVFLFVCLLAGRDGVGVGEGTRYKQVSCGLYSQWSHLNFSLT